MFERIVVGTDGSDTAAEAVRQATELAQGHRRDARDRQRLSSRSPRSRLREEADEIPGDVAYAVGPREDVNTILEAAAGPAASRASR